ncbi:MAG: ketoacyl-ACP synthase III, partial [Muribaculaceae bacterium]|nr:ketoacyl-ACP synthase III [Muribaculaceae bacterium]
MAFMNFNGVGVTALAAAVPHTIIDNYKYTEYFPEDQVKEVVDKVGIYQRRFADEKTCSSDLCFAAAEKLIADNGINREEIDLLVFISQTPDYRMPATSVLLQHRLGLPNSTIAFDVNLGCSAFIYGLSIVFSMMQNKGLRKALLLDGETRSKVYSPKDRRSAFLFGDGGVAALIERDDKFGESFFSLNSDGSRGDLIKINGGGYRNPSSIETLKEKVVDEFGNIRSDEQGYMNGGDVFNFVIREIPKDIKKMLAYSGKNL